MLGYSLLHLLLIGKDTNDITTQFWFNLSKADKTIKTNQLKKDFLSSNPANLAPRFREIHQFLKASNSLKFE